MDSRPDGNGRTRDRAKHTDGQRVRIRKWLMEHTNLWAGDGNGRCWRVAAGEWRVVTSELYCTTGELERYSEPDWSVGV